MLGKEAAVFVPSGTMSNELAVRVHCQPGDEILCEASCHIYVYEQGGFAQLSGAIARTVPGENGVLRLAQLEGLIRADDDHLVRTRLVCIENTHNRGGGKNSAVRRSGENLPLGPRAWSGDALRRRAAV